MACSDRVLEAVDQLIQRYPDYEVNVIGFSAGTHLAHYVANQLGRRYQEPKISNMITIASGLGIGLGIYSTEVAKPLYEHLYENNIDKYLYTVSIQGYNQIDNTDWIPRGKHFRTFYSPGDKFIPPGLEGGSLDYIEYLKHVGVITDEQESVREVKQFGLQGDHVSIVASLVVERMIGLDPYGIEKEDTAHWIESDFKDHYLGIVEDRMLQLDGFEFYTLVSGIIPLGSTRFLHDLTNDERAVVHVLQRLEYVHTKVNERDFDTASLSKKGTQCFYKRSFTELMKDFLLNEDSHKMRSFKRILRDVTLVPHMDLGTTYDYPNEKDA